jgi:excisionase family DNA binding protein
MPERSYTTHDIAGFCGVYPSTVVNWINSGKLRSSLTLGGHHRVSREDVIALLKAMGTKIPPEVAAPAMRVLIVDDDAEVTRVLSRAFARRAGVFATEVCHDGVEALLRIGQEPPDLVVLDLVLPKMDGLQVCRVLKAKADTRGIRIVAISGKKPPFNEKKPSDAAIDAFFRKPLDLLELVDKTAELLGAAPADPKKGVPAR